MIETIEIKGYRLLDNFKADLGKLTVVIGANATGKSTLLDFIKLLSHMMQVPVNEALGWHGGMMFILNAFRECKEIEWKLIFKIPDGQEFWKVIPVDRNSSIKFEVKLERDPYWQAIPIYEVLCYSEPRPGYSESFKFLESIKGRSWVFSKEERKLINFDQITSGVGHEQDEFLPEITKNDSANNISEAYRHEISLLLSKMRFYNEFPESSYIRLLLSGFAVYPGFEVGKFSNLRTKPAEIKPYTTLDSFGENLGTVLHEIFTKYEYRTSAEDVREFLKSAYPSFEEINAETAPAGPPTVFVRVREKGMKRSMELFDMSDGFLRFLCLAAALLNPVPPPFMAIDEPEAGLHPRLLPIVADMIKTASERTQVLVTTHSPDLLNLFDLNDIAVMSREENEISWHRPGNRKSLHKMLEAVEGDTLGDLHKSGELEALA